MCMRVVVGVIVDCICRRTARRCVREAGECNWRRRREGARVEEDLLEGPERERNVRLVSQARYGPSCVHGETGRVSLWPAPSTWGEDWCWDGPWNPSRVYPTCPGLLSAGIACPATFTKRRLTKETTAPSLVERHDASIAAGSSGAYESTAESPCAVSTVCTSSVCCIGSDRASGGGERASVRRRHGGALSLALYKLIV